MKLKIKNFIKESPPNYMDKKVYKKYVIDDRFSAGYRFERYLIENEVKN